MFDLRKLFHATPSAPPLTPELALALKRWQALPAADLDELHFHQRYLILDIAPLPDQDGEMSALAAVAVTRGGHLAPDDALFLTLSDDPAHNQAALIAFLEFAGKAPLVLYHAARGWPLLHDALRRWLALEMSPRQIDLAWLLPALFGEKSEVPIPLDDWLEIFKHEFSGRRELMSNVLELARLFQRALARAGARSIDTAAALLLEADASDYLRRTL